MSTITRERLCERARGKVKSLEFAVTQTAFADSRSELEEELELARIALVSLEAEAVAWRSLYYENHGLLTGSKNVLASWQKQGWECDPLYTAPPTPVSVPEDIPDSVYEILCQACGGGEKACNFADELWNACRAAMLQGADGI
ncbi:TPA: valyl-tRNA synthetase [Enterobacter kobei]